MHYLVIDDEWLPRGGTARALETAKAGCRVSEVASLTEAYAVLEKFRDITLVLLDLNLVETSGVSTLKTLRKWCEGAGILPRVVVLSGAADDDPGLILQVFEDSGTGFIEKNMAPHLFQHALSYTLDGGVFIPPGVLRQLNKRLEPLTPSGAPASPARSVSFTAREQDVASLLVQGLTYKAIASTLSKRDGKLIEEATVRTHVNNMAWKLGIGEGIPPKAGVMAEIAKRGLKFPEKAA